MFTVASIVKTSLDKRPDDLRDKRLLTFDSDKLTRVELQAKGPAVEFGKNGQNEWQILKPRPLRADGSQVDGLISKLKDAKMDLSDLTPRTRRRSSPAAPKVAVATVTDAGGTQTLEVRARQGQERTTPRARAVEGIYKVAADLGDALDKGVDDFRNKKLFDFGFSDPDQGRPEGRHLHQERRQVDVRRQDDGQHQRADPDRQAARPGGDQVRRHGRRARRFSRPP